MSAKDGGYAFPKDVAVRGQYGMTLRDYFAAQAMAAMITTSGVPCLLGLDGAENANAWSAYKIADAMLAQREATP